MTNTHLTIAGVDFAIGSDCEIDESELPDAYAEFIGGHDENANKIGLTSLVSVRLLAGEIRGLSLLERCFDADDMWSLFRDGEIRYVVHTGFGIEAPMWAAEFDGVDATYINIYCGTQLLEKNHKSEIVNQKSEIISSPMRYPLDQILLVYALAHRHGFLLHTAGVLVGGKLWLLAGRSRAGKSTASALLQGMDGIEILSDDRIVVRKIGDEFIGFGTPWPGEAKIASNKSAPLAGILFLDQSPENTIDEIGATDAFERLMPVVSVPWYEKELFPAVMDSCAAVAESVPMYRLQFRPDADAAEMLVGFMKF